MEISSEERKTCRHLDTLASNLIFIRISWHGYCVDCYGTSINWLTPGLTSCRELCRRLRTFQKMVFYTFFSYLWQRFGMNFIGKGGDSSLIWRHIRKCRKLIGRLWADKNLNCCRVACYVAVKPITLSTAWSSLCCIVQISLNNWIQFKIVIRLNESLTLGLVQQWAEKETEHDTTYPECYQERPIILYKLYRNELYLPVVQLLWALTTWFLPTTTFI